MCPSYGFTGITTSVPAPPIIFVLMMMCCRGSDLLTKARAFSCVAHAMLLCRLRAEPRIKSSPECASEAKGTVRGNGTYLVGVL